MGWHTSGMLIRAKANKTPADCVREFGFENRTQGDSVAFDEATGYHGEAVLCAEADGWFYLIDPALFTGFMDSDEQADPQGIWPRKIDERIRKMQWDVVSFTLAGSVGLYGFAIYQQGELVRAYLQESGEVQVDFGVPSHLENELRENEMDGEQFVLDLVDQLTNYFDAFEESEFWEFEE